MLKTSTTALATLTAATAVETAAKNELITRITRAAAEIAELEALVTAGATGKLDEEAKIRADDLAALTGAAGEFTLATAEKAAADGAIAGLTSTLNTAKTNWDNAGTAKDQA